MTTIKDKRGHQVESKEGYEKTLRGKEDGDIILL